MIEKDCPITLHNRLSIKGIVATIVLLFSLLVLSLITGTHSLYVDIVNGNEKHVEIIRF